MSHPRKPKSPNESLMGSFIYSNQENQTSEPQADSVADLKDGSFGLSEMAADVIAEFKSVAEEPTVRFTVDLPKSMHRDLGIIAKKLNTNMSKLNRVLIEKFLQRVKDGDLVK